ncbi:CDGSH iron-sulfur domain-containing protein [Aquitalea pelogenes]
MKAADALDVEGDKPYPVRERMTLCRCGASANKPFCDGSHASIKWQDGL